MHLKKILQQGNTGKLKLILIGLGLIFLVLTLTGRAHALFAQPQINLLWIPIFTQKLFYTLPSGVGDAESYFLISTLQSFIVRLVWSVATPNRIAFKLSADR